MPCAKEMDWGLIAFRFSSRWVRCSPALSGIFILCAGPWWESRWLLGDFSGRPRSGIYSDCLADLFGGLGPFLIWWREIRLGWRFLMRLGNRRRWWLRFGAFLCGRNLTGRISRRGLI